MDIIRRILQGYFGYSVNFVQNVTDIDDKVCLFGAAFLQQIIIRARQTYIWKEYLKSNPQIKDVEDKVIDSWKVYACKIAPKEAVETYNMQDDFMAFVEKNATLEAKRDEKFTMHLNAMRLARAAILEKNPSTYFESIKDIYLPVLDKEVLLKITYLTAQNGEHFTELSIFKQFTTFWEQDYNADMAHLNVLRPTRVIRVSDVVPEIVAFVEKIIDYGCAYATKDGDVYFDVRQFQALGHQYAKLKPSNAGDTERLLAEGEGSLSLGVGKKSVVDFALWKSSKPGEPRWPSPWGEVSLFFDLVDGRGGRGGILNVPSWLQWRSAQTWMSTLVGLTSHFHITIMNSLNQKLITIANNGSTTFCIRGTCRSKDRR